MEHAVLHAVQLIGIVLALAGPFLVLGLLRPAARAVGTDLSSSPLGSALTATATRWAAWGALAAAGGALLDLLVQSAELKGETVFGGADLSLSVRFAAQTAVGNLMLLRIGVLLLAAAAAWRRAPGKWWVVGALAIAAAVLVGLVSHAAAQPSARGVVIASQVTHICAAAAWLGVLMHLLAARRAVVTATEQGDVALLAEVVRRFSPVALGAAVLIALSGVYITWRFLGTPGAVLTSTYGLTLILKLILLIPVLVAGFANFRFIRPALAQLAGTAAAPDASGVLRRFGRLLELEVTAGILVITVAGIVGSISPPGDDGALRLSPRQVEALLSPDTPTTNIGNLEEMYRSAERTILNWRYAEFTHNWSGVFVILMGASWLLQGLGGPVGAFSARFWPALLVPFALFVAIAADPQVWILRQVTVGEVLRDPQQLEHQIGAAMVLLLAWLGWRDLRKPAANRPLGYALPVVMILGSVLLLGHAHSALNDTEELTNLITVQHAVFGTFGLLAGTVRWLDLRGLFPHRAARLLWPSLIVALGVFMAFFYREVV